MATPQHRRDLGERLRRARKRKQLSQHTLRVHSEAILDERWRLEGREGEPPRVVVPRIESAAHAPRADEVYEALAEVLEVRAEWLRTGAGPQNLDGEEDEEAATAEDLPPRNEDWLTFSTDHPGVVDTLSPEQVKWFERYPVDRDPDGRPVQRITAPEWTAAIAILRGTREASSAGRRGVKNLESSGQNLPLNVKTAGKSGEKRKRAHSTHRPRK